MAYTSDSESPDDFHFWSGVSTIAGALQRRVWINMRKFQWTPNFYIILVGPAGIVTKSTSMRAGMRLLEQLPDVHFGPPSTTWQALTEALAKSITHLKHGVDENGADIYIPMSCLTIHISELGTFLKPDDQSLVDVITDLWDGQLTRWGHSTKTTGNTDIRNPWLNVIGCVTPSWMRKNIPEHTIGGGLMSRVIFIFGSEKRKLVPYPDEVIPDAEYKALEKRLVEDLLSISSMAGEFILSPSARDWGRDWYAKHWNGVRPSHMASDRYEGYIARKQTHMHKLALVLAAARSDDLLIRPEHLQEADALLTSVERHMLQAFESIGVVDEARHVASCVSFVRAHNVLTPDDLWKLVGSQMAMGDFEKAVKAAVRGGLLSVVNHPTKKNSRGAPERALTPTSEKPTVH
jgi:hypothetical protein